MIICTYPGVTRRKVHTVHRNSTAREFTSFVAIDALSALSQLCTRERSGQFDNVPRQSLTPMGSRCACKHTRTYVYCAHATAHIFQAANEVSDIYERQKVFASSYFKVERLLRLTFHFLLSIRLLLALGVSLSNCPSSCRRLCVSVLKLDSLPA